MAEANPDVVFIAVDVDENEETSGKCGISCMPTFQYYKDGAKVDELQGADENQLAALVAKHK
jgi:thioredoxin-like negative regulator of GroEL